MAVVDLDGVAAAEGDGGAASAGEVAAGAVGAGGAVGVARGHGDLAGLAGPDVEGGDAGFDLAGAGENAEGERGLPGGDDGGDGVDDSGGFAGGLGARGGVGVDALEAGGLAGEDGHGEAITADGAAVDPGQGAGDAPVVEEVAGFEVIGGIEDEVSAVEEVVDVGGGQVGDVGDDFDVRVDGGEVAGGGGGFGEGVAGVGLGIEPLALEVGEFNEVAIDEEEAAGAGAGESAGLKGAEGAAADDGDRGLAEAPLAGFAPAGEANLAGITSGGGVWGHHT